MKRDQERGLYDKYHVERLDDPTGKHTECEYYVLDLVHDRHAAPALLAYADSCEAEFPDLARDLRAKAAAIPNAPIRSSTAPKDETAWLVEDSTQRRYRTMDEMGPGWTEDVNKAIRFARRADAEMFSSGDEDAWHIVEHMWCAPPEPDYGKCSKCGIQRHQPMPECAQDGCPLIAASATGDKGG